MNKKIWALMMAAVMGMGVLAGCGGGEEPAAPEAATNEAPAAPAEEAETVVEDAPAEQPAEEPAEEPVADAAGGEIAILVPSADHGWTGAVLTYAKEKADELNAAGTYTATVLAATDAKNQQEQVDDLLASATPPAGIVILPYDNTLESSMANVAASGIKFVMFDRIIDNPVVQGAVAVNVKGDNEGIGAATAKRFVEKGLQAGDKLYVMIGDTSSVPEMRNNGFTTELKTQGWTDEQIATIEFSAATGWSRAEGKKIFIDWINAKTVEQLAEYKYIFTHDDEIAMGILEALSGTEIEEAKKTAFMEAVVCLGTSSGLEEIYQVLRGDHPNAAFPAIVANFDLFSVTYDPGMIKISIDDMVGVLGGTAVEKEHTVPVSVVDPTNVGEFQGFGGGA